jgi:hypothetical protein
VKKNIVLSVLIFWNIVLSVGLGITAFGTTDVVTDNRDLIIENRDKINELIDFFDLDLSL